MDQSNLHKGDLDTIARRLDTLIELIARAVPAEPRKTDFEAADAFVWNAGSSELEAVERVNRVDIALLQGVERARDQLVANTTRFARGFAANNVLLWGARGMGKSSLVKAAHARINADLEASGSRERLKLVEIHREDIESLPTLMRIVRASGHRTIVFCDDLSFDSGDASYKSLKAALDGGIEGRPATVLFYATSNRRHLLPRDMIENESSTAINPGEAVEEKVSLSDRFGLWLGFHKCSQDEYLAMIEGYVAHYGLAYDPARLRAEALEWSTTRGSRSGRVAFQFIQALAGRLERNLGA
jgi:predicted AAA+ superfamily ATPase